MSSRLTLKMIKHPAGIRPESRPIEKSEFLLGRGDTEDPPVDWILPDSTLAISRRHCVLSLDEDVWSVIDKSRNGTFLNHEVERLPLEERRPLNNHDRLRIGDYVFQVEIRGALQAEPRRSRTLGREPQRPAGALEPSDLPPWLQQQAPAPEPAPDALLPLLEGAELDHARIHDPDETLRRVGAALRALVTGLRKVEAAQRTIRSGFRIRDAGRGGNPLSAAPSEEAALEAILSGEGAAAVQELLARTARHELATMTAMQSAIHALLQGLSPDMLQQAAEQNGNLSVLGTQRKARAWEAFEARYAQMRDALQDDFDRAFGKSFAEAYERALQAEGRREWS